MSRLDSSVFCLLLTGTFTVISKNCFRARYDIAQAFNPSTWGTEAVRFL